MNAIPISEWGRGLLASQAFVRTSRVVEMAVHHVDSKHNIRQTKHFRRCVASDESGEFELARTSQ